MGELSAMTKLKHINQIIIPGSIHSGSYYIDTQRPIATGLKKYQNVCIHT